MTSTTPPSSTATCSSSATAPRPGSAPPAWSGRTITIKVRFADFTTITRSRTLRDPTDVSREVYAVARALFDDLGLQRARFRLVGVRMEGLADSARAPVQGLLDAPEHGWRDADRAVDRASARFGAGAVRPASLVEGADSAIASPGPRHILITGGRGGDIRHPSAAEPFPLVGRSVM